MSTTTLITTSIAATLLLTYLVLRLNRARIYARLRRMQADFARRLPPGHERWFTPPATPDFGGRLAILENALPLDVHAFLRGQALADRGGERSWLPGHKQGGTVAYEDLHQRCGDLVAFYLSDDLRRLVSATVGEDVKPTPVHDQSSCSLLIYEKPGDHIGWHYDHDFYRGRHFTVLLSLANERLDGSGVSSSTLQVRRDSGDISIPTPANTLVIFEGARILHRASALGSGQRRVLLSMTFCTDERCAWWQAVIRRCKDIAYFGPRALWT